MRPSAELRPPGVYPVQAKPQRGPLQVASTDVPGFIGLARQGPLDTPVRLSSWDEFVDQFGYTADYYLSDSVEVFFRNGGAACYVVRVAHSPEPEQAVGPDHAACAELVILDDWNKQTVRVRALNEGKWGNHIWVGFEHATGARSLLTLDLDVGAGEAHVANTRGFEVGALVRIYNRESEDFVVLTEVEQKLVRWGAETPVNRRYRAAAPTHLEVISFDVQVALRDRREVFKGLQLHPSSRRCATRVIESESKLIRLEDLGSSSPPPNNLPDPQPLTRISGGHDGTDVLVPEDFVGRDLGPGHRTGLMSLIDAEDAAILVCPDAMVFLDRHPGPEGEMKAQRVQDVMVDFCENSKERFAVLDCPLTRDIEEVLRWRRRTDSSYAAYYWPWIVMPRPGTEETRRLPPSGIMAGIYAQQELEVGVHQAPANVPIVGATDVSLRVTEDHLGMLNAEGVNGFRITRGVRPWGARTASSDPDWIYVNVRRLFIMLRRSLELGMAWVTFEPHNYETWASVQSLTQDFLRDLFQQGMFAGGNSEEAFFVKCDEENNPTDQVDEGKLVCQVGVAPAIPAEFIMIDVVQEMPGAE